MEIAIALNGLGPRVEFVVLVERELNGRREVIERHPIGSPISLDVPASDFDAARWRV